MTGFSSFSASMGHSGFDTNAASLCGQRQPTRMRTVETSGPPGKRRRVEVRTTRQHNGINDSANRHESPIYDNHLLANQGPQRLVGLSLKVGKQLGNVDHYGPFLKMLNQSGRITTAWNGILASTIDARHVSMQVFRHTLADSDAGNLTQANYPQNATNDPHIMYPQSATASTGGIGGESLASNPSIPGPGAGDVINQPFYRHSQGQVSFAPMNLPDLEDMSWNLNRIKLVPDSMRYAPEVNTDNTTGVYSITPMQVLPDVTNYQVNKHRKQSAIRQNNYTNRTQSGLSPTVGSQWASTSPATNYRYNACLKHGKIAYEFMNKNDSGATVEVIVYRVKKTADLSADSSKYQAVSTTQKVNAFYPLSILATAVATGYVNTVGAKYATENFQGRMPEYHDIYSNPSYPLLPILRKTVDGQQPFVEVMRNKFAMTAGSRRSVTVNLPGKLYDPAAKQSIVVQTDAFTDAQLDGDQIPIIDEDAYCVVLAVNGQKMTRFFDSKPQSGTGATDAIVTFRQQNPISAVGTKNYVDNSVFGVNPGNFSISVESQTGISATVQITLYNDGGGPGSGPPQEPDWTAYYLAEEMVLTNGGAGYVVGTLYDCYSGPGAVMQAINGLAPSSAPADVKILVQTIGGSVAVLPTELPMGDNHGAALVDYCATYTEHLGACVYKEPKEQNLYDCGQPVPPSLTSTVGSTKASRQILPATSVVRQAQRIGYEVDNSGNPTNVNVQSQTSTGAGPG